MFFLSSIYALCCPDLPVKLTTIGLCKRVHYLKDRRFTILWRLVTPPVSYVCGCVNMGASRFPLMLV
jgi:hypothetical protein